MSFKSFLSKHAVELGKVAGVLSTVISALPIDRQDKRNLGKSVGDLVKASENIAASASDMIKGAGDIDRDTLKDVLREILPDLISGLVEKEARKLIGKSEPKKAKAAKAKPEKTS